MSRAKETFNKKEIQKRKEKKRKDKVQKRLEKKESDSKNSPDDMIAYVDEYGRITSTPPEHEREKENKVQKLGSKLDCDVRSNRLCS